jgi:hypothetical protein
MKINQSDKKLSFNKKTIANLGTREMGNVNGGSSQYVTCPPLFSFPKTECFVCQP